MCKRASECVNETGQGKGLLLMEEVAPYRFNHSGDEESTGKFTGKAAAFGGGGDRASEGMDEMGSDEACTCSVVWREIV